MIKNNFGTDTSTEEKLASVKDTKDVVKEASDIVEAKLKIKKSTKEVK